jgi:hypothetical protein
LKQDGRRLAGPSDSFMSVRLGNHLPFTSDRKGSPAKAPFFNHEWTPIHTNDWER